MADTSKLSVDLEKLIERTEMAKVTTATLIAHLKELLEESRRAHAQIAGEPTPEVSLPETKKAAG